MPNAPRTNHSLRYLFAALAVGVFSSAMPVSGCSNSSFPLGGGCGSVCSLGPTGQDCSLSYDAGTCDRSNGMCSVRATCECIGSTVGCVPHVCRSATTETACAGMGSCSWSVVCDSAVDCGSLTGLSQAACESHPQCKFEGNQGCM